MIHRHAMTLRMAGALAALARERPTVVGIDPASPEGDMPSVVVAIVGPDGSRRIIPCVVDEARGMVTLDPEAIAATGDAVVVAGTSLRGVALALDDVTMTAADFDRLWNAVHRVEVAYPGPCQAQEGPQGLGRRRGKGERRRDRWQRF
jgi:hypothetical protein